MECIGDAGEDPSTVDVYQRMDADAEYRRVVEGCVEDLGVALPELAEVRRAIDQAALREHRCIEGFGWELREPTRGEGGYLTLDGIDADIPAHRRDEYSADVETCFNELPDTPESTASSTG